MPHLEGHGHFIRVDALATTRVNSRRCKVPCSVGQSSNSVRCGVHINFYAFATRLQVGFRGDAVVNTVASKSRIYNGVPFKDGGVIPLSCLVPAATAANYRSANCRKQNGTSNPPRIAPTGSGKVIHMPLDVIVRP
jgi:hypothetical protein